VSAFSARISVDELGAPKGAHPREILCYV